MARDSGNKSYNNLLIKTYEIKSTKSNTSNMLLVMQILFNFSGYYNMTIGNISSRAAGGHYWISGFHTNLYGRRLIFEATTVNTQDNISKGRGNSVRCGAKFATDSICPKGWEMARYEGNRSFRELLTNRYPLIHYSILENANEADSGMKSMPLSFNRTGYYVGEQGVWSLRKDGGMAWESFVASGYPVALYFVESRLNTQNSFRFNWGFFVRCVAKCGDATDSICPKGWEMARYDGDGSYYNLLLELYGKVQSIRGENSRTDGGIISNPLSYVGSGNYNIEFGISNARERFGTYWCSFIGNLTYAYSFNYGPTYILTQTGYRKSEGFSACCVAKLKNSSAFYGSLL